MPQVNLLPPETRERQRVRKHVGLVSLAGVALVGLLVLLSSTEGAKIADLNDQLAQVQSTNATLQTTASHLQPFEDERNAFAARLGLVQGALSGGVRWSHVLQDLSHADPGGMWLTTLAATMGSSGAPGAAPAPAPAPVPSPAAVSSPAPATSPGATTTTTAPAAAGTAGTVAPGGTIVASLSFQGWAVDVPTISQWLTRLEAVNGWANAWVSQAQKTVTGNTVVYQFSGTVDVTAGYLTKNGTQS
jgi:hypothetical protein